MEKITIQIVKCLILFFFLLLMSKTRVIGQTLDNYTLKKLLHKSKSNKFDTNLKKKSLRKKFDFQNLIFTDSMVDDTYPETTYEYRGDRISKIHLKEFRDSDCGRLSLNLQTINKEISLFKLESSSIVADSKKDFGLIIKSKHILYFAFDSDYINILYDSCRNIFGLNYVMLLDNELKVVKNINFCNNAILTKSDYSCPTNYNIDNITEFVHVPKQKNVRLSENTTIAEIVNMFSLDNSNYQLFGSFGLSVYPIDCFEANDYSRFLWAISHKRANRIE
jgi:hypothetical protein